MSKEKQNLGEKIKEIQNDIKSQQILLGVILFCFDLILIMVLVFLICCIKSVTAYVVGAILFIGCLVYSVLALVKSHTNYGYKIYQNCIEIKNVFDSCHVYYKDILKIDAKTTFFDKIFKKNSKTITLTLLNYSKVKLFFVTEDADKLVDEIKTLSASSREIS